MTLIPLFSCKKTDKEFRYDCKVDPADSILKWMPSAELDPAGKIKTSHLMFDELFSQTLPMFWLWMASFRTWTVLLPAWSL